MKKKIFNSAMTVIFLAAVYVAACVLLPVSAWSGNSVFPGVSKKTSNSYSVASKSRRMASTSGIYGQEDGEDNGSINIDLTTKKVVIDSGHGGFDSGKEGSNGILEKDINLAIAKKLKALLEDAHVKVVMTREDDNGLYSESDSNKKIADMKRRCDIIDEAKPDIVVSVHQNSFQSSSVEGAQVFYYKHSAKGKKLAQIMQKSFRENLDAENKRVEKSDTTYYMLVHTSAPTIIAECGFLSNPGEAAMLVTDEYQQKVAQALYNGIVEYFIMEH